MATNEIKLDQKATNYLKGKFSKGGVQLVDTLPEVGNENTLYKTPDGKIWSCTTTIEEKVISDLEVGKSYKFKDKVTAGEIKNFAILGKDSGGLPFNDNVDGLSIDVSSGLETPTEYDVEYYNNVEEKYLIYLSTDDDSPEDLIEPELDGFTEIPSATITQTFVDNLEDANMDLLNIAFLFVGGSHTETVTTSTWTEVGSGSGSSSPYVLTIQDMRDIAVGAHLDVDATISLIEELGLSTTISTSNSVGICMNNENSWDGRIYKTPFKFTYYDCASEYVIYVFSHSFGVGNETNVITALRSKKEDIESYIVSESDWNSEIPFIGALVVNDGNGIISCLPIEKLRKLFVKDNA